MYQRPSLLYSVSLRNVNWLTDPNLGLSYSCSHDERMFVE